MPCSAVALLLLCYFAFAPATRAQSLDHVESSSREVTYSNGDVMLAGTLLLPSGKGPFPAVVIIHGSGSSDRSNPWTATYASAFVERGVAVLHPDKRGSGESGGNWREASFSDLADDAVAAIHLLRTDVSVDSTRIGLIGFSQGGHVAPVATTRSSAVCFVINVSGSVVPILEQIGDELRKMGEREGLSAEELRTIQLLHDRAVDYALTRENWTAYSAALAEAQRGALAESEVVKGFPADPDSGAWEFLRTIGNFDPLPHWREVEVPALFLYGGRDENVDVFKSAGIIEESLTSAGLPYSLLLFRNNGHALFREDAMDFIARWIHSGGTD
jgi:pimeloyl-ACP methyl ester carboxylesterase